MARRQGDALPRFSLRASLAMRGKIASKIASTHGRHGAFIIMNQIIRLVGAGLLLHACMADAAVLQVGPGRSLKTPSAAAFKARNGDVIEIDAGTYAGDVAVWRQQRLTIRGVRGYAHLKADGHAAEDKAIWVIKGDNTTVEYVEFSGARVSDENGAGIRQEGADLTVKHCYFHDNENGILGGAGEVVIESSEFANNGFGDGQSHNIYIGERTRRFTLRASYSHHANVGHAVKSRAEENRILYNRLSDESTGVSSYLIDLPNGGLAYVIGNVIQQGPQTENTTLLSYGAEESRHGKTGLYVVNNTFVNDHDTGVFIRNANTAYPAIVVNNIFAGPGKIVAGPAEAEFNWAGKDPGFRARADYDYRLNSGSPAIDQGVDPGNADGFSLIPRYHYTHPLAIEPRPEVGKIDFGAYEFTATGNTAE